MNTRSVAMMQTAQQVRSKLLTLIVAGVAGVAFANAATAAGAGGSAQVAAPGGGQAGGSADAHISPAGSANSNAQWQSGATRGTDHAAERMSTSGDDMRQAAGADLESTGKANKKGQR